MTDQTTNPEACPGCGCLPGQGRTAGCTDPDGCGYWADLEAAAGPDDLDGAAGLEPTDAAQAEARDAAPEPEPRFAAWAEEDADRLVLVARVGQVDMHGYNGRELHPEASDSGQVGRVMRVTVQEFEVDPVDDADVYRVMLTDGRVVDLVEHEIAELFRVRVRDLPARPDGRPWSLREREAGPWSRLRG